MFRFGGIYQSSALFVTSAAISNSYIATAICPSPIFEQHLSTSNVAVEISNNGGRDWSGKSQYVSYYPVPSVTSIFPTFGPVSGGTSISISGSSILPNYLKCRWNSTSKLTIASVLTSQLSVCIVPEFQVSGTYALDVSNDGVWFSNQAIFTVTNDIRIESVFLPLGSNVVTITGSGFVRTDSLRYLIGDNLCRYQN